MKKFALLLFATTLLTVGHTQKNLLTKAPVYQIFEKNIEVLAPNILISNKVLSKEEGISEKLEIQSFQKSEEKNDINVLIEITKYLSNPLNENPMAKMLNTQRTLDQKLSLNAIAFNHLEGDAKDAITKAENGRTFSQVNIDPEEESNFRTKKGGEKMKKKEFGMNLDAMFNYVNSLLKGSFHDAEAKWESPKEYRHFYYAAAGNMYIKVEVYAHKTAPDKAPNARKIADEILRKLPQDVPFDIATNFEVYPKYNSLADVNEVGLIPASSLLPAKVVYKVGKPNESVVFSLLVNSSGELRIDNQKGKSLTTTSDARGEATVWYYYTDQNKIKEPVEITIVAEADGKSKKALIHVGLGLAFDQLKEIPEQVYEYSPEKPYAFALSVKSLFHPEINLPLYIRAAHESQIWGNKKIGVELVSTWVNKPDEAPADDFYVGSTFIESTMTGSNSNVLVANRQPWQYYTMLSYPAVTLKSPGTHMYEVTGEIAVLDGNSPEKRMISFMSEKMSNSPAVVALSAEYPERWYKSIACALASVDNEQTWFILEAIKLIPTYGMIADAPTAASQFICGLLNGDYQKSIIDLASWLGGQYIDKLMEPKVFNLLDRTKQDAVLSAKTIYFGEDMYKKKSELELLRETQKNKHK